MYIDDKGKLILGAGDLVSQLVSEHLTRMYLAQAKGEIGEPVPEPGDFTSHLKRRGVDHEAKYLQGLKDQGLEVVEVPRFGSAEEHLKKGERVTREAMKRGAPVIYQGTFFDGQFRGHADFLIKVDKPSDLGNWSYEVLDTKLKREADQEVAVQIAEYSHQLERVQGTKPELMHVVLGDDRKVSLKTEEGDELLEETKRELLKVVESAPREIPEAVYCHKECPWRPVCKKEWKKRDLLSQIPSIKNSQIEKLWGQGIKSMRKLAEATPDQRPKGMGAPTYISLVEQAQLLVERRKTGEMGYRILEEKKGFGLDSLPDASPGDVFFDIEGDPLVEGGGLEYLLGVVTTDTTSENFRAFWGHDRVQEKKAFEDFIDFVANERKKDPKMHVYHYAAYEPTAMKRLANRHGVKGQEVNDFIQDEVFIDLYQVVKKSLQIGTESYSLKKLEPLYLEGGRQGIKDAASSVVAYEEYLLGGGDQLLEEIERYNEDDCVSTMKLRDWLLEIKEKAIVARRAEIAERSKLVKGRAKVIGETPEVEIVSTPEMELG